MANQLFFSVLMLATGIGIPVMATLSAAVGTRYGSPALAASVLFFVALSISVAFLFAETIRRIALLHVQEGVDTLPSVAA